MRRAGPQEVWSKNVGSGAERKIISLDIPARAELHRISTHPDGKRFLTRVHTRPSYIWIIDGFAQ